MREKVRAALTVRLVFVLCKWLLGTVLPTMFEGTIFHEPPTSVLESIYFPSLDKNVNSSADTTLTFDITITNHNAFVGIYYDPINITFYDSPNRVHCIANFVAPRFHQSGDGEEEKVGTVITNGFDREAAMRNISAEGHWVVRVDLSTSIRYNLLWSSRMHKYKVGANVKIGDTGIKVHHKEPAELTSKADKIGSTFGQISFFILNLFVLCFLHSY
ncbi:hypothetical protein LUZ60_000233 [Juncus effusus]|nr:hypothetical protein LUZ60_000233 [Juncus effusus]